MGTAITKEQWQEMMETYSKQVPIEFRIVSRPQLEKMCIIAKNNGREKPNLDDYQEALFFPMK